MKTLSVSSFRPDGRDESVLARLPVEKVIEAFANAGAFERLYAKAFVVFTFQIWEEVARPGIAVALKVKPNHVQADLIGEWRRLRNWLVHRNKDAEDEFFGNAVKLPGLLELRREDPGLTAGMVYVLMRELNRMQVDVNPESLQFGLELAPVDAGMIAGVAKTLESGAGAFVPAEAAMYPSRVLIVFNSETATIHERDCDRKDTEFQSVDGGRWVGVSSLEVAREVIENISGSRSVCASTAWYDRGDVARCADATGVAAGGGGDFMLLVGDTEERAPTPTAQRHGTGFLGCPSRFVARVGEPPAHRPRGHRGPLASRPIPTVLGKYLAAPPSRSASD